MTAPGFTRPTVTARHLRLVHLLLDAVVRRQVARPLVRPRLTNAEVVPGMLCETLIANVWRPVRVLREGDRYRGRRAWIVERDPANGQILNPRAAGLLRRRAP